MKKLIDIRPITRKDVPQCVELGYEQFSASRFNYLTYDREKIRSQFLHAVDHPRVRAFVVDRDGELVGIVAVSLEQYEYNYDTFAMDHFYYIKPAHRKGLLALKLFRVAEQWAKENRALEIQFNFAFNDEGQRIANFMDRIGYVKYNEHYKKLLVE